MKHLIEQEKYCTGCGACIEICPTEAITLKMDALGRKVAYIDKNKCIDCGSCVRKCHAISKIPDYQPLKCFAALAKDDDIYQSTSSGGLATIFGQEVIKKGGCVYGAAFKAPDQVEHIRVDELTELDRLKGSKYVLSKTESVFNFVLNDLKRGLPVLFVGTPCQVAALLLFLPKKFSNLITVDLICHGTPPQTYFSQHLNCIVKNKKADNVSFRVKNWALRVQDEEKILYERSSDEDYYFSAFLKGLIFQAPCYECKYAKLQRCADITIGDFWGIGRNNLPDKYKSIVLINTPKADTFWETVQDSLHFEQRDVNEGAAGNSQLNAPSPKPDNRMIFEKVYIAKGFHAALLASGIVKECNNNMLNHKKQRFVLGCKRFIKRIINWDGGKK